MYLGHRANICDCAGLAVAAGQISRQASGSLDVFTIADPSYSFALFRSIFKLYAVLRLSVSGKPRLCESATDTNSPCFLM